MNEPRVIYIDQFIVKSLLVNPQPFKDIDATWRNVLFLFFLLLNKGVYSIVHLVLRRGNINNIGLPLQKKKNLKKITLKLRNIYQIWQPYQLIKWSEPDDRRGGRFDFWLVVSLTPFRCTQVEPKPLKTEDHRTSYVYKLQNYSKILKFSLVYKTENFAIILRGFFSIDVSF